MKSPSIYIPRILPNINKHTIHQCFTKLIGPIKRIDMVQKKTTDGQRFQIVFIHFSKWSDSKRAQLIKTKLLDGKSIKIVYDEPNIWKCQASRH